MKYLALIAALAATPATAQLCTTRQDAVSNLQNKYSETVVGIGLAPGGILEVWVAPSGSFTVTITRPDGLTCMVASGESYEAMKAGQPL